jgi:NifU-like protein involved in Fe-S cluster formation
MDHFLNPRNAGEMEWPDAVGQAGSPSGGEFAAIQLRMDGDRIIEARFQTFGCGPAIAACSALTEWAMGKDVEQAAAIDARGVAELLGGLPEDKLFCAQLAIDALRDALAAR